MAYAYEKSGNFDGDYIYIDDIMFSGSRVQNDLKKWIENKAPKKATIHVILVAIHIGGYLYTKNQIESKIKETGKDINIHYWRAVEIENRKYYRNKSEVLWPTAIPSNPEIEAYIGSQKYSFEPRIAGAQVPNPFSSEQGRQILETEFFLAGIKIRNGITAPKFTTHPLGFGRFALGFGSLITTYRNCPNNCPLALWWGDPEAKTGALHWYPLLQRKTYASPENIFGKYDDQEF